MMVGATTRRDSKRRGDRGTSLAAASYS